MNAITRPDYAPSTLVPTSLSEAVRFAEMMSQARTVPKHLQSSPGDCLMVVEQAMRWGMSPFAVAQATSVISGKLMFEGKLVAAAVETSGAITGHLDYEFGGEGETRTVTVSATRRGETSPRSVSVALKEARTNNEMWKRQPDQQLVYHGARVWARRWTPAVILGVYSREEMGPIIEGEVEPPHAGPMIEAKAEPHDARMAKLAPVYDTPEAEAADDGNPEYPFATAKGGRIFRTGSEYLEQWRRLIEACRRTDALDKLAEAIAMNRGTIDTVAEFDPAAAAEVREMVAAATAIDQGEPPI